MSNNKRAYEIGVVHPSGKLVTRPIEADVLNRDCKNRLKTQENPISREVVVRLIAWLEKL